jgi:hypothetical protein
MLKERKLIEYHPRGDSLERQPCECYRIIKNQLDDYAEINSGIVV